MDGQGYLLDGRYGAPAPGKRTAERRVRTYLLPDTIRDGKYITFEESADPASVCSASQGPNLWALNSLLNLTADLTATKSKSSIILKGIAADLNLEGYLLEYADVKSPESWNLIQPLSDIPVVNEVFTAWVPPYEGSFYVRLTVGDKAGNSALSRKSVSWGQHSSITNLYTSHRIFSSNNDGVKDTIELYYRVLDPVHLQFTITDGENSVVKTLYKDHALPTEDYLQWFRTGNTQSRSLITSSLLKWTIRRRTSG
jgi:large repetitive protein